MISNSHPPETLPLPTAPNHNSSRRSPPTASPPALASHCQTTRTEQDTTRFAQFPVKFMQKVPQIVASELTQCSSVRSTKSSSDNAGQLAQ